MKKLRTLLLLSYSLLSISLYARALPLDSIKSLVRENPSKAIIAIDSYLFENPSDSLKPFLIKEKGYAYQNLRDYEKSNEYLFQAYQTIKRKRRPKELIYTEIAIASNFAYLNEQNDAIRYATQAIERAHTLGDTSTLSSAYTSISHVYYMLGQVEEAKSYLHQSESLLVGTDEKEQLSVTYNNLGILYRIQGQLAQAIKYNTQSLALSIDIDDRASQAKSYNNIARVYLDMNDNEKAKTFLERAIALNDSIGISNSNPFRNLAEVYNRLGNFESEEKVLLQALEIEKGGGRLEVQKEIYRSLVKNAVQLENYSVILLYQHEMERMDAAIQQKMVDEKLEFMEAQKTILENELKWEREAQRARTYRWVSVAAFLLALAILIIFIQKRKQQALKTQEIKSRLENKVLRSQMNPHFIFNTLTIIQNSIVNNNALQAASSISKFAKLIRQIFNLTQEDAVSLREDLDVLQNYVDTQLMRFNNGFDYRVATDLLDDAEEIMVPPMMLQPFIENAIEHGIKNIDRRGEIKVVIKQVQSNRLVIKVLDNGRGYNPQTDGKLHATQVVKDRLKLNNQRDVDSFYITKKKKGPGTEVGFQLTLNWNHA